MDFKTIIHRVTNLIHTDAQEVFDKIKERESAIETDFKAFVTKNANNLSELELTEVSKFEATIKALHDDALKIADAKKVLFASIENVLPALKAEGNAELLKAVEDVKAFIAGVKTEVK